MRLHLLTALAAALLFLAPSPARAADPFQVAGVPVDATAKDAVEARAMALAAGQRDGLKLLMQRLTLPESWDRLPRLENTAVERYVASFQIAEEKVAPTRYLASMTVTYLPDQVRGLLARSGVPYLRRLPEPVLVVPALGTDGGLDLWLESNPWRAAWNAGAGQGTLMELRLPLGDLDDVATLSPEAAAGGDPASLQALAQRYGTTAAVLAKATPEPAEAPGAIALELRRSDRPEAPFLAERLTANPDEDEAALFNRAAARAAVGIEEEWKRTLIVPDERVDTLSVGVPLVDLASWVQIRQGLSSLPEVRSVRVERLTRQAGELSIGFVGDLDRLAGAVQRLGLMLVQESGGWQLRPAGDLGASLAPQSVSPALP